MRLVEAWTPTSLFPAVERDRLTWHPAGAAATFTLDLSELFRPIWGADDRRERLDALRRRSARLRGAGLAEPIVQRLDTLTNVVLATNTRTANVIAAYPPSPCSTG